VKQERLAIATLILVLVGLPLGVLGYQRVLEPTFSEIRVIDIRASAPENGGFQPASIQVAAGETVRLRFHSTDVTHGIAIGPGLSIDLGQIDPGHVGEITVNFSEAGTYTYYCNTWCSADHWRMRGVIEAVDPASSGPIPTAQPDPVIAALAAEGIDIDASLGHTNGTEDHLPEVDFEYVPSAAHGADVVAELQVPSELHDVSWRFSHAPAQGLEVLRANNPEVPDALLVDAIAYLWAGSANPSAQIIDLYNKNCSACHGQSGGGDGPAAELTTEVPAAFSNPAYMWEMRGDVLYAKIRRGGMGTDMPNFGTLFTQQETRDLVDYLLWLAFRQAPPSRPPAP